MSSTTGAGWSEPKVGVRGAAIEILARAEEGGHFIDETLSRRRGEFEGRDRGLLQEITYGTVRHQNTLDQILKPYVKKNVARQQPPVRWALRAGVYQLVYLERVPAHAAVNQTLEGLKTLAGVTRRDVGFVNAVLRRVVGDIQIKSPEPPATPSDPAVIPVRSGFCRFSRSVLPHYDTDPVEHLSLAYSHPSWLVRRWLERYGEEEVRELMGENNRSPRTMARVTKKAPALEEVMERLREEGFTVEPGPVAEALVFLRGADLESSATLSRGWVQIQDATAMQLGSLLRPPGGARVLDLCAAPGGKATQLLEAVGEDGFVVAADRGEERLERLRRNLGRLGSNYRVVDLPRDPDEIRLEESFTHVLVDAPCSNTGVLARRPDARWRLRPRDLGSLAELQASLLRAALRHLTPGGRLVYSTCSIEPEENEERVAALLREHADLTELETLFFLPHRSSGDGGYASLMRRGRLVGS